MQDNKPSNAFAAYIAAGRIIAMLCSFAMPIFLTRYLSKTDYGLYNQFYTVLLFLGSIFTFGIQSNLYYYYPTADDKTRKSIVGNTFIMIVLCGLIAFLILQLPFVNRLFIGEGEIRNYLFALCICICFYIPTQIIAPLFVVRKDKLLSILLPPTEVLLKLFVVIGAALVWGTIDKIFNSIVILQALLLIIVCIYSFYGIYRIDAPYFNYSQLKNQLSYALPFGFAVVLNAFAQRFDKIISISFLTTEDYATYSLAFFGVPGILQIYDSVCQVNVINMTKAYQAGQKSQMHEQYKDFCTKMLSFSLPLILVVFVFSREIIEFLFSEKYISSVPIFRIYILSIIITILGAGTILRAVNKTKFSLKAYAYSSIVSLPLTYFLIKEFGIWGAIISCLISQIIPRLIQIHFEKKVIGTTLKEYMPWNAFLIIVIYSCICIVPVCMLRNFFSLNIYACGFIGLLYLLCVYMLEIRKNLFLINQNVIYRYMAKLKNDNTR